MLALLWYCESLRALHALTATIELLIALEMTPATPGQYADEYYGAHDGDGSAAQADSWTGGGLGRGGSNTCSSDRPSIGSGQRAGPTLAATASGAMTLSNPMDRSPWGSRYYGCAQPVFSKDEHASDARAAKTPPAILEK